MEIGMRIKKKREAMGMTRAQLAAKIGCSPERISQFERGRIPKRMGGGVMARLKRVLKVRARGVAKPARNAKVPRSGRVVSTNGPDTVLASMGLLLAGINRLAASLDGLSEWFGKSAIIDTRPSPDLSLVPSVKVQKAMTEAMTQGIAKNGLRRPLASNSLDSIPPNGVLLPVTP